MNEMWNFRLPHSSRVWSWARVTVCLEFHTLPHCPYWVEPGSTISFCLQKHFVRWIDDLKLLIGVNACHHGPRPQCYWDRLWIHLTSDQDKAYLYCMAREKSTTDKIKCVSFDHKFYMGLCEKPVMVYFSIVSMWHDVCMWKTIIHVKYIFY